MGINIKERFKDRKNSFMRNKKLRKKKQDELEKDKDLNESPIKIAFFSPLIFFGFIKKVVDYYKSSDEKEEKKLINSNNSLFDKDKENKLEENLNNKEKIVFNTKDISKLKQKNISRSQKVQKDNTVIVEKNKKEQLQSINKVNTKLLSKGFSGKIDSTFSYDNRNVDKASLEIKIFAKFKAKLSNLQNNTDIIESELYLLNKYSNDHEILEEAKKVAKEVEILLDRLDKINNDYQLIKNNNSIDNSFLLDDTLLIDDIINYRKMLTELELNNVHDKLNLLDEYNYLYDKLEELENKASELKNRSENRVNTLSKRDKKYREAKNKIKGLDEVNSSCNEIINKNNKYLKELYNKVDKIESKKLVEYKLKGLNGLLGSSLKYLGFLSLTPLRGLIPGIAARTLATRKLVHNMIENIHYEKQEKIVYSLMNYQSEISNKIYDIDSLEENLDITLSEIKKLKEDFKNYFFNYHLDEYEDSFQKIIKLEEETIKNKEKTMIIKNKLIKNKELNKKAVVKVKKLNNC